MASLTLRLKRVQVNIKSRATGVTTTVYRWQLEVHGMSLDNGHMFQEKLLPELQARCHYIPPKHGNVFGKFLATFGEEPGRYQNEFQHCLQTLTDMGYVEKTTQLVEHGANTVQTWTFEKPCEGSGWAEDEAKLLELLAQPEQLEPD